MPRRSTTLGVDLIGAAVTAMIVAVGIWCVGYRLSEANAALNGAREHLADTRTRLSVAERELNAYTEQLDALNSDIAQRGALPSRTPVETDLKEIAELADAEGMELLEVTPTAGATYPGLRELRYTIKTNCEYQDLVRFLRRFQDAELWADILKIEIASSRNRATEASAMQPASLYVSLFSTDEENSDEAELP